MIINIITRFSFKKAWISILLFFAVFTPPLIKGVNIIYLVALFSLIMIGVKYCMGMQEILHNKNIKRLNISFALLIAYYFIPMSICINSGTKMEISNYINVIYRFVANLLLFEPICIYVVLFCAENKYDVNHVVDALFRASFIEFFFCLACLISPDIKTYFTHIMIENTGYYTNIQPWTIRDRFWGFASTMTDYFGYSLGLIMGLGIVKIYKRNNKYFVGCLALLLMIVLNSTTGLVVGGLFLIFSLLDALKLRNISFRNIIIIIFVIILTPVVISVLSVLAPTGFQKILDNIYQIIDPTKVEASNTSLNDLFSERFWQIPPSMSLIIWGTGHSLLGTEFFRNSDVGFINDIWSFGIVGTAMYFISYMKFIKKTIKNEIIYLPIIFSVIAFNVKGVAVGVNSGAFIIMLLCFSFEYLDSSIIEKDNGWILVKE